ncbi:MULTISPECIES: TerC family protein [Paenibacillus]|uniref:TerC family protein n=1 Tax=Paenibacillus TaxID=44249 RepID=UPI0022B87B2A|nr:TerC family protein [Paenibacillus caseinilyticus]MCZ8518742.1 TerC family protein [Paenibacillus caseinilyticus]
MWDWLLLFMEIMLINVVLSGDNAVVIAMASKNLPPEQRRQAVWWGAFGAIALRIVLTIAAVYILDVPYIHTLGALLLLWIAIKLLTDEEGHSNVTQASTLGRAVWTIIVADFVMSLDNVLAIAAKAEGDKAVIILGIGLSVPIIIWGSTLVMNLLKKFPVLVYLGAAILGFTAGEMMLADEAVYHRIFGNLNTHILPLAGAALVILCGLIKRLLPSRLREN